MAARFLLCLPLRLGVFVISLLQFLFCGAIAGSLWWALSSPHSGQSDLSTVTHSMKIITIIVAAIYSAAAFVAIIGLFGAILSRRGLVKTIFLLIFTILVLEIGSSIWYLITFYRNRHGTLAECVNGSTDSNRIAYCDSLDASRRIPQGLLLASVIVPIVLQAYACYIVYHYSKHLAYQRAEKQHASQIFQPSKVVYQPVKAHDDAFHMSQTTYQYPYADTAHSFGYNPQHSLRSDDVKV